MEQLKIKQNNHFLMSLILTQKEMVVFVYTAIFSILGGLKNELKYLKLKT